MNNRVKEYLRLLKKDLGKKKYVEKSGSPVGRRFWNQLREDLMRQKPESLVAFLENPQSRLTEIFYAEKSLALDLSSKYKELNRDDSKRYWHEALILFCLENDVGEKVNSMKIRKGYEPPEVWMTGEYRKKMKEKLQVWEV